MALKKADEKTPAEEKTVTQPVAEKVPAEPAAEPVVTDPAPAVTDPTVVTDPPADPVVEKTQEQIDQEAAERAAFEQARLDDEAAVNEQAGKPEAKKKELVEVENLRPTAFMQYSTGKWIQGHSTEWLLDDGWLANHVKAKLLKLV